MYMKNKKIYLLIFLIILGISILGVIYYNYLNNNNEENIVAELNSNVINQYNNVNDVSKILDNPKFDSELRKRKEEIEKDEQEYGDRYLKFTNFELYSRKPDRIIFKQGNKDGFFIFEKTDKAYEHLLVVSEDRMSYAVMQDYNLWCFTPDSIEKMTKSGDNYIIYDFDNGDLSEFDNDFQKDVIFRFNTENRLYRLVSYLSEFKEAIAKEELGKDEFATNTEISGYKYMMYNNDMDD